MVFPVSGEWIMRGLSLMIISVTVNVEVGWTDE